MASFDQKLCCKTDAEMLMVIICKEKRDEKSNRCYAAI